MKTLKRILSGIGAVIFVLILIVLIRTFTLTTKQAAVPVIKKVQIDKQSASEHLSKGIQFRTVSFDNPGKDDYKTFRALQDYIDTAYPLIHQHLQRTVINDFSLLFEWKGRNTNKKPIILTAHLDVVPVDLSEWKLDPFSGEQAAGIIWGRGALDDKGSLFAILEAVENLLAQGFIPERTIYLGFGHDEEAGTTGGMQGARNIAAYLMQKHIHAESILDEGGIMANEELSLIKGKKLALIAVAEKGFMTLRLTAEGQSGHAMMPPAEDLAILRLAKALVALDKHKLPSSLDGTVGLTFDYLAPEMPFVNKLLFANKWLFGLMLQQELAKNNLLAAMMHTTVAPTVIQGGVKEQSLPASASLLVNFRILPGETSKDVINHVVRSINDSHVKVELYGTIVHEPIPLSGLGHNGYQVIDRTIREIFPGVVVAPVLSTGRTDSLYYKEVADDIYRFAPYVFSPGDDKRPHGKDEFIRADNYFDMIQFYIRYIQNSTGTEGVHN